MTLGLTGPPVVIDNTVTPPVSPTDGDSYVVGGTGTGDWTGLDQRIVTYHANWPSNNGWVDVTPDAGMQAWVETGRSSNGELIAYNATEDEWFPVQDRWSYTEHWTGKYAYGGEKIMSKMVSLATWPIATSKTWSIGASGTIDYTLPTKIEGSIYSTATTNMCIPITADYITTAIHFGIRLDAGNVRVESVFDMSSYSAEVRLEYCLV